MLPLSSQIGIGGKLKESANDFIVEEITKTGKVIEIEKKYANEELGFGSDKGNFCVFIMQKMDWNTVQALKTIAKLCGRGIKSVGFAGTKDRTSVSTQLCSIFGADLDRLSSIHVKDIKINGAWLSNTGIELGDLTGNRFTVTIKDAMNIDGIESINSELNGLFPNYFGEQRFGFRNNNVDIGLDIIKGNFEGAAIRFLTDSTNETNGDAVNARKRLYEERDFKSALEYFPNYLKYERDVIRHLSITPTDFAGALRRLPRSLSLMFVHSVESSIFNKEVEQMIRDKRTDMIEGNLVGYESETNDYENGILEELGITKEQFKVKSMPELNCKGGKRLMFAPYKDFSYSKIDETAVRLKFSLQSGSYATVFLNEFIH